MFVMPGEINRAPGPENNSTPANDPYEIKYLAAKMNVSEEAVKEAIRIVGNNTGYLEAYLKR